VIRYIEKHTGFFRGYFPIIRPHSEYFTLGSFIFNHFPSARAHR
jgi:hypothetical protein